MLWFRVLSCFRLLLCVALPARCLFLLVCLVVVCFRLPCASDRRLAGCMSFCLWLVLALPLSLFCAFSSSGCFSSSIVAVAPVTLSSPVPFGGFVSGFLRRLLPPFLPTVSCGVLSYRHRLLVAIN